MTDKMKKRPAEGQTWKELRAPKVKPPYKISLLPEKYQEAATTDPDKALKYYIKELVENLYDNQDICWELREILPDEKINLIINDVRLECTGKLRLKDQAQIEGFLEMATLKGMKKCLELNKMAEYFAGCRILSNLYGVGETVTVRPDYSNPFEVFGEEFVKVKLQTKITPELVEARFEEHNKKNN
jgi:hypothetical protein